MRKNVSNHSINPLGTALVSVNLFLYLFFVFLMLMPFLLNGQESAPVDPTLPDIVKSILDLVKNWKGNTAIAIISAISMVIIQCLKYAIKNFLQDPSKETLANWSRFFVVLLGVIVMILSSVAGGMSWIDSSIFALITSSGAIAIYQVFKPLMKKKEVGLR